MQFNISQCHATHLAAAGMLQSPGWNTLSKPAMETQYEGLATYLHINDKAQEI